MGLTGNSGVVKRFVGVCDHGCLEIEIAREAPYDAWRNVFFLPPIEYTPKPGDVIVIGHDETDTPFTYQTWCRINDGPRILYPEEMSGHTLTAMWPRVPGEQEERA